MWFQNFKAEMNVAQVSTWRIAQAHVRRAIPKTPMRMINGMLIMNTFRTMKATATTNDIALFIS